MKNLIPVIALVIVVLGCGRFQSSTGSANDGKANSAEKPVIRKVVDVPALFGKTKEEVIKAVTEGKKKNDFSDWMDFEFPQGTLRVSLTKDKADNFSFVLPMYGGDFLVDTQENFCTLTGIDLKGKSPDSTIADWVIYEKEKMNGVPVEITFTKKVGSDLFYSMAVKKAD